MQLKQLFKKNSVTVVDGRKKVIKKVKTPFAPLTRIWCRHEAECLLRCAKLGFSNVPKLVGLTDDSFSMEKIEGRSLESYEFITEQLFLRVMNVVREFHGFGFAHGNLRPDNILIMDAGKPVLIDFETCCQTYNPLFFLARFSDHVKLHLFWQSRVVKSNPELVRRKFPGYLPPVMFVITPFNRFLLALSSAKKWLRRVLRISAERRDTSNSSDRDEVGSMAEMWGRREGG